MNAISYIASSLPLVNRLNTLVKTIAYRISDLIDKILMALGTKRGFISVFKCISFQFLEIYVLFVYGTLAFWYLMLIGLKMKLFKKSEDVTDGVNMQLNVNALPKLLQDPNLGRHNYVKLKVCCPST